ncbi:hypothetical protein CH293_02995 [Rhodococcus sp. 14-2470-1b]|uniref:hypothetical protein n=1 Tax=Rhodococcus sp. 14-2470-1b TaxID=2023149 RepID=UPI000B9C6493|nr:hypothetical protein [Rhodococcus sp. 14-2470-1b]OZF57692.1 hypothetical protein CH293_02995 [Rhodococcus sp. 14-2470-1b]
MIAHVLGMPFRAVSAMRAARAFHPNGVHYSGALIRSAPEDAGLPLRSCEVSVRMSKGIGLPSGLPDVAGLALRLPTTEAGASPSWDVLLAGSATGRFGRMVPWPSSTWNAAHFSSLMPLKYRGRMWWLRARITAPDLDHMSTEEVRTAVATDRVSIAIEQACGWGGGFVPAAVVHSLVLTAPGHEIDAFDPVLNSPAEVRPQPECLRALRLSAYRNSRAGRAAADPI